MVEAFWFTEHKNNQLIKNNSKHISCEYKPNNYESSMAPGSKYSFLCINATILPD